MAEMAEAAVLLDSLGPVLTRWTMGGSAATVAPEAWREALGSDPAEAEVRLLALAGQLLGAMVVAEPAGEVKPLADLPVLAKPPLPDPLRARTRRLLRQFPQFPLAWPAFLALLDRRGWTLHPADWLPRPNDELPDTYAAWQDWAAAAQQGTEPPAETLTAESWDDFGPAARHAAFAALRRHDPAGASALLQEKITGESADHRLRLLEAVAAIGLSDTDRPLLDMLKGDRAARVKALALALLARLGHGEADGEDAAELAGFFSVQTKGVLRRTQAIVPQPLKTPAQQKRREALFTALSLDGFAQALALPPERLAAAWPWGKDQHLDYQLADMVARSASDALVTVVAEVLTSGGFFDLYSVRPLLPRLTRAQRRQAVEHLLGKGADFVMALTVVGADGELDGLLDTNVGGNLLAALQAEDAKPIEQAQPLLALGLLASRAEARRVLERLAAAGLIASDPRLDMLRLNAALEDTAKDRGQME